MATDKYVMHPDAESVHLQQFPHADPYVEHDGVTPYPEIWDIEAGLHKPQAVQAAPAAISGQTTLASMLAPK